MNMMKILAIFACVVIGILADAKRGECPTEVHISIVIRRDCRTDYECNGNEKCCGDVCVRPAGNVEDNDADDDDVEDISVAVDGATGKDDDDKHLTKEDTKTRSNSRKQHRMATRVGRKIARGNKHLINKEKKHDANEEKTAKRNERKHRTMGKGLRKANRAEWADITPEERTVWGNRTLEEKATAKAAKKTEWEIKKPEERAEKKAAWNNMSKEEKADVKAAKKAAWAVKKAAKANMTPEQKAAWADKKAARVNMRHEEKAAWADKKAARANMAHKENVATKAEKKAAMMTLTQEEKATRRYAITSGKSRRHDRN